MAPKKLYRYRCAAHALGKPPEFHANHCWNKPNADSAYKAAADRDRWATERAERFPAVEWWMKQYSACYPHIVEIATEIQWREHQLGTDS